MMLFRRMKVRQQSDSCRGIERGSSFSMPTTRWLLDEVRPCFCRNPTFVLIDARVAWCSVHQATGIQQRAKDSVSAGSTKSGLILCMRDSLQGGMSNTLVACAFSLLLVLLGDCVRITHQIRHADDCPCSAIAVGFQKITSPHTRFFAVCVDMKAQRRSKLDHLRK